MISRLISIHEKSNENVVIASIQNEDGPEHQCFAIDTANMLSVKFSDIQDATRRCQVLTKVSNYVKNG